MAPRRLLQLLQTRRNSTSVPSASGDYAPSSDSSSSSSSSDSGMPGETGLAAQFSPSMAIILVVLLTAFFFMGFFSVYVRRCTRGEDNRENDNPNNNDDNQNEEGESRRDNLGLDPAIVATLPMIAYSRKKGYNECAVCLTEFQEDEAVRILPKCKHAFHPSCIDMWLFSHTTCPVCRRSLLSRAKSWRWGSSTSPSPVPPDNSEVDTSSLRSPTRLGRSHSTGRSLFRKTLASPKKPPTSTPPVLPPYCPRSRSVSHVATLGAHPHNPSPSGSRPSPFRLPAMPRVWSLKRMPFAPAMAAAGDAAPSLFSLPVGEASSSASGRRTFERLFPK